MKLPEAWTRIFILLAFFVGWAFVAGCDAQYQASAPANDALKVEKTLAEELLELEGQHRELPPASFELLQRVLNEGVAALGDNPVQPRTADEAIAASETVARVLAKHNFFQPTGFQVNPTTLGEALTPKLLPAEELESLLAFDTNPIRIEYYSAGHPVYLVDCDMGSLILVSIFDRLDWDTRLVKAPAHVFLRWHLPNGETVNWDWSNWGSFDSEHYLFARHATAREQVSRGTYLRSLPKDEARGGFIGLIGARLADGPSAVALLERAIELAPDNPATLHSLAWAYASDPQLARDYGAVAVMYAHRAVAADLSWSPRIGLLACAYAADHQWALAASIMTGLAEEFPASETETVQNNLNRIRQKQLCGA